MEHPADVLGSIAGVARAGRGFIDEGMVGIFVVEVVGGTLLGEGRSTGLSQKHCWSR